MRILKDEESKQEIKNIACNRFLCAVNLRTKAAGYSAVTPLIPFLYPRQLHYTSCEILNPVKIMAFLSKCAVRV